MAKKQPEGLYPVNKEFAIKLNDKTKGIHTGLNRWVKNQITNPDGKMQYANAKQICDEIGIDVSELLILDCSTLK
ncbi:hypothetical protein HMI01_29440 [Halolactibacillus miurensis]|uniref:Uncharacterized protein n=1 Tax=Halolactibacillus miurensis TaxID=306541 RepID=A0A1I6U239_9BACI|nr:hypothetical protein [Halolactibacillus miurensis]GEM05956.1 hypothetical protein HMI01_29440 [Halolactibacillus miurensis]SFS95559.1 hypothetical protein SAMN05421668_1217 [Halolactibacillus miurensis]